MNFENKRVLITGASRGVGRACARMFAEHGAHVAVHYRHNRKVAEETLASLSGTSHMLLQADIRDAAAVRRMVDSVVEAFGRIDVLVNSAGIYELHPIRSLGYEDWQKVWDRTLQTNLVGAANVSFCVVQQMLRQGGGRIVNISSRGAFRGEPEAPAYGASKAGLNAFGQSLAKALAPQGIYVFTVAPGFVETDMSAEALAGPLGDEFRRESPMGRAAKPEEVARTVVFLASEGSEYLTGCIVDINGASYLRT
jgi:NAD(P)-dependent dehydrogenase (short-subunit alcohol dehydrogenase family)